MSEREKVGLIVCAGQYLDEPQGRLALRLLHHVLLVYYTLLCVHLLVLHSH